MQIIDVGSMDLQMSIRPEKRVILHCPGCGKKASMFFGRISGMLMLVGTHGCVTPEETYSPNEDGKMIVSARCEDCFTYLRAIIDKGNDTEWKLLKR